MPANDDPPLDTAPCMLTRREVAARLGISTSSVRRLEWDRLHPVQDERGVWRFDPAELQGLEPKHPPQECKAALAASSEQRVAARRGRLATRVFRMFSRNLSLAQIVVATRQPPEAIRDLYREWGTSLEQGEWDRRESLAGERGW